MRNIGCTCYLNSVFQLIFNNAYLISLLDKYSALSSTDSKENVAAEYDPDDLFISNVISLYHCVCFQGPSVEQQELTERVMNFLGLTVNMKHDVSEILQKVLDVFLRIPFFRNEQDGFTYSVRTTTRSTVECLCEDPAKYHHTWEDYRTTVIDTKVEGRN